MSSKYNIDVSNGSTAVTSGQLEVDTSVNPNTGSFTPASGTGAISCTNVAWPPTAGQPVSFTFRITTSNGGFLTNTNGTPYTYVFTGTQGASAASGSVRFPNPSAEISGPANDVDDTWQSTAVPQPVEEAAPEDTSTYEASS